MKHAQWVPYWPCGPEEWNNLQEVLAPEFRLKLFQFKTESTRVKLVPIYKGKGNGICLNVLFDDQHYRHYFIYDWIDRKKILLRLL